MTEDPMDYLLADFDIGQKGRDFLNSDIGRYIMGRADEYAKEQMQAFDETSVKDEEKLIEIKINMRAPLLLKRWILEALQNGEAAEFQIKQIMEIQDGN